MPLNDTLSLFACQVPGAANRFQEMMRNSTAKKRHNLAASRDVKMLNQRAGSNDFQFLKTLKSNIISHPAEQSTTDSSCKVCGFNSLSNNHGSET